MGSISERNNVKIFGGGERPMMFAHGFGCDQNMWRFITPAFENDYRIVLFDYVGSGGSDANAYEPSRYVSLDGYVDDVLDICRELDLKDVIFVGHSVSAMIGLLASLKAEQHFGEMILIGPSPCYVNESGKYVGGFEREEIEGLIEMMDKNYIGWANFLAPVVMKNAERPELARELEESFCSTDPVIARRFAEATFLSDNRRDLAAVKVPSLVMQCSDDMIAPLEVGDFVHANLQNSTLRVMDANGHCPHMSHPEEVITVIKEYLAERAISEGENALAG